MCLLVVLFAVVPAAQSTDLTGDLVIDCDDLIAFEAAFGATSVDPEYRADADLNSDGTIDGRDLTLFMLDFPPSLPCHPFLDPDRFVPLDPQGEPVEGQFVQVGFDGSLPPLVFRPGGHSPLGRGQGLNIRLEQGAQLIKQDGENRIQFFQAGASFGSESSLAFEAALVKAAGPAVSLPLSRVDLPELAQAFGLDPGQGIPVISLGQFPMQWRAGILTDRGIEGAQLAPRMDFFPLPDGSQTWPNLTLRDISARKILHYYHGTFELSSSLGTALSVVVSPDSPLLMEQHASGEVAMKGRVDVLMPGNGYVRGDLLFDDPVYRIELFADDVNIPLLDSLADLLPSNPSGCVPASTNAGALNVAADCLEAHRRAYRQFSAAVAAATPAGLVNETGPASPPDVEALAGSVLNAWAYAALAPTALPLGQLQELVAELGRSASASADIATILRYQQALMRAKDAITNGGLTASSAEEAELDAALAEAEAAAIARSEEPGAVYSLESMRESLGLLVETESMRATLGIDTNAVLLTAIGTLLNNFAAKFTADLGVATNVYTPTTNAFINNMNRFTAFENVKTLVDILSDAAVLGIDDEVTAPLDEALAQLALQLFATASVTLNSAEAAGDPVAFSYALEDLVDLVALQQTGVFPAVPELANLPGTGDLPGYAARLDTLLQADLSKPAGERSLGNQLAEVSRLLNIVREMPGGVTFAAPPFQRAYDRLEPAIAGAMIPLNTTSNLTSILELLEAGIRQSELADRFGLTPPVDWVGTRLPLVAARLKQVGEAEVAWSELDRAAVLLLVEADRLAGIGDQVNRKAYLDQAGAVLESAEQTAVALWLSEESIRASDPLLASVDMILPGDIRVRKLNGSMSYNRLTERYAGALSGELLLPKFDASLTIKNAAFDTGGFFELNCHGTVSIPGSSPVATLSIPARRPLRLHYNPYNGLALAGSGRIQFSNGLAFESDLVLEDPVYGFGIRAEGLRLGLAKELTLLMPTVDASAIHAFDRQATTNFLAYYTSMSRSLEPLVSSVTNFPSIDSTDIGVVPTFEEDIQVIEFDELQAFANAALPLVITNITTDFDEALTASRASLSKATETLNQLETTFQTEKELLAALEKSIPTTTRISELVAEIEDRQKADPAETEALRQELIPLLVQNRTTIRQMVELSVTNLPLEPSKAITLTKVILNQLAAEGTNDLGSLDSDGDGILDEADNCPGLPNPAQTGPDTDGDGILDTCDNCLDSYNALQRDDDGDGVGFVCDPNDLDPLVPNPTTCDKLNPFLPDLLDVAVRLFFCGHRNLMEAIGLDPISGDVADTNLFNELTIDELDFARLLLVEISGLAALIPGGTSLVSVGLGLENIATRELELVDGRGAATNPKDFDRRFELLAQQMEIRASLIAAGGAPLNEETVREELTALVEHSGKSQANLAQLEKTLEERARQRARRQREVLAHRLGDYSRQGDSRFDLVNSPPGALWQLSEYLRVLQLDLPPGTEDSLNAQVKVKLEQLKQRSLTPEFLGAQLSSYLRDTGQLLDLATWVQDRLRNDPTANTDIVISLSNLTFAVTAQAEVKKAFYQLDRYGNLLNEATTIYGTNINAAVSDALLDAQRSTVVAAKGITDSFTNLLNSVSLTNVVMTLPGDLQVVRVFGNVRYNRETEFLSGQFGGRIEFPDIDAFFDIQTASIASDGSFSIAAATETPLPFDGVSVTASLAVVGDAGGLQLISGSGSAMLESGQSFSIDTISYDVGAHKLAFGVSAGNLDLRFTDDFVLFDAGVGFEISTLAPQGRFTTFGSAGMFARESPLPAGDLTSSNFFLVADGITTVLNFDPNGFSLGLTDGTLNLPEYFSPVLCEEGTPETNGPSIQLGPASPINVTYQSSPVESVSFTGSLGFDNIGVEVPGITGLVAEVCSVVLDYNGTNLPALHNLYGKLQIPLPDQNVRVAISNASWDLMGFPEGLVTLLEDVTIFDQGGFQFTLLSSNLLGCATTGLTVSNSPPGTPLFRLDGGFELGIPVDVLSDDLGGQVSGGACGYLTISPGQSAEFGLGAFQIGPVDMQFGGTGGFTLSNATVGVLNLQNLYNQTTSTPFILTLDGGFQIPDGPGLTLQGAEFRFIGETLPRFSVQGLSIDLANFDLLAGLPVTITAAGFQFLDPNAPLPDIFAPSNIVVTMSGQAAIPPLIFGAVENLTAAPDNNGVWAITVEGIGMGVTDLPLGPLLLTGQVYVQNALLPDWYFAGQVGGQLVGQDLRLVATLAFDGTGPIGVCLDVAAGPAGIPIGPTGFLLSGAQGGLTFVNQVTDPCDFLKFISIPAPPAAAVSFGAAPATTSLQAARPPTAMTWEEVERYNILYEQERRLGRMRRGSLPLMATAQTAASTIPCPTGDCPPATVGILCQPHPDTNAYPDRVIFKLSSFDEAFLNSIGITSNALAGLNTAGEIAGFVSLSVSGVITNIIPPPDPVLLGPNYDAFNEFYTNSLNELSDLISNATFDATSAALGSGTTTVYQAVVDAAYAGAPCPRITAKLAGNLTHAAVSTFLSAQVGVVESADITGQFIDSAGVVGTINLLGIPVGNIDMFVNLTDAEGLPNPSFCGDVLVSFGPLEVGTSKLQFECPGCVTELLSQMGGLFVCAGSEVVDSILAQIAPEHVGKSFVQLEADLTDEQKIGFLAALFSQPPGAVPDLAPCFFAAISNSWDAFQPKLVFCSSAQPKLFGMPMGAEISSTAGLMTKTNLIYTQAFSPSYMLLTLLQMQFFPAADSATLGVGLTLPDAGEVFMGGLSGQFNSPQAIEQHLLDGFQMFLEDATFTIDYQFTPFGLKMVNAEARVIMPNLTNHPAFRAPAWQPPTSLGYPSRLELLLAAADLDMLSNPFWKGTEADLYLAFPEGSPERDIIQSNQLSFASDYFPHGGIVGAATLTLPPAITEAPPEFFFTEVLNPGTELITRLVAMKDYVEGYILNSTSQVGSLAFYLPAPNPPSITDSNGMPLDVIEVMEQIKSFDLANLGVGSLYPVEASFLRGHLQGQLVGIPLLNGEILAIPGDPGTGSVFQVSAEIPPGSWFQDFVSSADLEFVMRSSPTNTIESTFTNLYLAITNALATSNNVEAVITDVYNSLADGLPKTSFELAVNDLHIPDGLTNLLTAAGASASFYAYSPRFEPGYVGTGPVAKARRDGGIALSGALDFAGLVQINNAELGIFPNEFGGTDLAGLFDVPFVGIDGLGLHDGLLEFNTDPDPGQPFFRLEGEIDPINLGPFFVISNLAGDLRIGSVVAAIQDTNGVVQGSIEIDPALLSSALFGPTFEVRVHGATTNDPFTFSTDGPWTATLSLGGQLELTDGISTNVLLSIAGNTNFTAQLTATGLVAGTLTMELPTGVILTAFPGQPWQQTIELAPLGLDPISLTVSSDGRFELSASADINLALTGLPISTLSAGGSVLMTESSLLLTGEFSGGFLAQNGGTGATGTLEVTAGGGITTFSASATLPPLQFGVFRVSGVNDTPLEVTADNTGFAVPSGANLAVVGVADRLLTLEAFTLNTNGNFNVDVSSGDFVVSNYFSMTGGNMTLARSGGITMFDLQSPLVTFFPSETYSNSLAVPGVTVDSTGAFLVDTGVQSLDLPGLVSASGQLKFGYEPETNQPALNLSVSSLSFGIVDIPESSNRVVTLSNPGNAPVSIKTISGNAQFTVQPQAVSLAVGASADLNITFTPNAAGFTSSSIQLSSDSPFVPVQNINVSGTGRTAPKFYASSSAFDFGPTVVGAQSVATLTLANIGSSVLHLGEVFLSPGGVSSGFAILQYPGGTTLNPGDNVDLVVRFSPVAETTYQSTCFIATTELGGQSIQFTGSGSQPLWYVQRDADNSTAQDLRDIEMGSAFYGLAAGAAGTLLETYDGGRSWTPRCVTTFDLNAISLFNVGSPSELFLRLHFEEPTDASAFQDLSGNNHHFASPNASGSPAHDFLYGQIGKGLLFDGNDSLDGPDFSIGNSFAIRMWINPSTTADGQNFIGKHDASGNNIFLFGFYNGGYHIRIRGVTMNHEPGYGGKTTGWQLLEVYCTDLGNGTTLVSLLKDNSTFGQAVLNAVMGNQAGKGWTLGQDWDGGSRTDFFNGMMDEVLIAPSANIIPVPRIYVAGAGGQAFVTQNGSAVWTQIRDNNVRGWQSDGTFLDTEWRTAGLNLFAGSKNGQRALVYEYSSDVWSNAVFQPALDESPINAYGLDAIYETVVGNSETMFWESNPGTWSKNSTEGSLTINKDLHGVVLEESGGGVFVVVGQDGVILRRTGVPAGRSLANTDQVTSPTTETLRDLVRNLGGSELYAVGDNGTYLLSPDFGQTWQDKKEGQFGELKAIDYDGAPGSALLWAAGDDGLIIHRPAQVPSGPIITMDPGVLDFGFLLVGQSRTREFELFNRGTADLAISSMSVGSGPFLLGPTTSATIPPGESATFSVKYRPTASANVTFANLDIVSNDPNFSPATIVLKGQARDQEWQLISLGVEGEIVDLDIYPSNPGLGMAIVDRPAGYSSIYRSTDYGVTWAEINYSNSVGFATKLNSVDYISGYGGFAVGGDPNHANPLARSVILRTVTAGASWTDQTSPGSLPFSDAFMLREDPAYVFICSSDPGAGQGNVWETSNSGGLWSNPGGQPDTFFDGTSVNAWVFNVGIFAGIFVTTSSESTIYARIGGNAWNATPSDNKLVQFDPAQAVRSQNFADPILNGTAADVGWIVGDNGLCWRADPPAGGAGGIYFPAEDGEVFCQTDLKDVVMPDYTNGFMVGESRIFRTKDGGRSWDLYYDGGTVARINSISADGSGGAWAGGSLGGNAMVWRLTGYTPPPTGVLAADDIESFGTVELETSVIQPVTLRNQGSSSLTIHQIVLEDDDPQGPFELVSPLPTSISAGGSATVNVRFTALQEPTPVSNPILGLKFEDTEGASSYVDYSVNQHPVTSYSAAATPVLDEANGYQGRGVRFDGNDSLHAPAFDIEDNFTLAAWVNPESTTASQCLFGKHAANGANQFLFGFYLGTEKSYWVYIRGASYGGGAVTKGWQHLAVTGQLTSSNTTHVTCYKNGTMLWSTNLNATVGDVGGGLGWTFGQDWDGGPARSDFLQGSMDNIAMFNRALTETEIIQLATETRATGRHTAQLKVNASGEVGEASTLLRADVTTTPHVVTLDTEPSGLPLTVDGVTYTAPVAFTVQDDTTTSNHWGIGSSHVIDAQSVSVVTSGGGEETSYGFQHWNLAGGETITVDATRDLGDLNAQHLVMGLTPIAAAAQSAVEPPIAQGMDPVPQGALAGGYPAGPFIRLSNAALSVPFIDSFTVQGDLYLSALQFNGTLSTTSIDIPDAAPDNLLHVGAGEWTIDYLKNSHFKLESSPPAVRLLGKEMAPQTFLSFNLDPVDGSWTGLFSIPDGFKPLPEIVEFGPSSISVAHDAFYSLTVNGTMRLLRLPDQTWAAEDSVNLQVNDGPFAFNLTPYLPNNLIAFNGLTATKGTTTLARDAAGAYRLGITNSSISMFGQSIGTASGSVGTDGALDLVSTTFTSGVPAGPFSLEKKNSGDVFRVKLRSRLPNPSMRFSLPRLLVKSGTVIGWPVNGVEIPGLEFNVDGAFDTGKVPLRSFTFDGIGIATPEDGTLRNNYVRLKREADGDTLFKIKAEVPFPFPPPLDCATHTLRFEIQNGVVSGTYSGKFCLPLDKPVSLDYNSGSNCQFQLSADIYDFYFGSTCHGVCSGGVPIFGVCP